MPAILWANVAVAARVRIARASRVGGRPLTLLGIGRSLSVGAILRGPAVTVTFADGNRSDLSHSPMGDSVVVFYMSGLQPLVFQYDPTWALRPRLVYAGPSALGCGTDNSVPLTSETIRSSGSGACHDMVQPCLSTSPLTYSMQALASFPS